MKYNTNNSEVDIKGAFLGSLPDDPPLLEELGISLETIKKESMLVFNVFKPNANYAYLDTPDISGPILFILIYSFLLLMNGKAHFGYIYFITLCSTFFIYFLLNVMSTHPMDLIKCYSVLGYSILPIVIFALVNLCTKWMGVSFRLVLGIGFSLWSSVAASFVFTEYLYMKNERFLIGYPIFLVYLCYSLMVIF
ncbi:Protein transport protein yip1 [Astathelohania contejeani]|uniref:Protein YIP n=1 Tax=Astathelohania contejeani TaxID=164912 RepID=A0ABQ7I060_9MICR|nr:Protein transport protein yip1 [Thelohania contejeani]